MAKRAAPSANLTRFFRENYAQAIKAQISIDVDPEVVAVLAGVLPYDDRVVKRFMAKYNLLRNCTREEIEDILSAFFRFWRSWRAKEGLGAPPHLDRDGVRRRFDDLFLRLYKAKKRNWISGTSKLLWCMYPEQLVIYDRFVHSALSVLHHLEPVLCKMPRIGANHSPNEVGRPQVVMHYMRCWDLVQALRRTYRVVLADLWEEHGRGRDYRWQIRVLDKLLVYLGNPQWVPGKDTALADE